MVTLPGKGIEMDDEILHVTSGNYGGVGRSTKHREKRIIKRNPARRDANGQ